MTSKYSYHVLKPSSLAQPLPVDLQLRRRKQSAAFLPVRDDHVDWGSGMVAISSLL